MQIKWLHMWNIRLADGLTDRNKCRQTDSKQTKMRTESTDRQNKDKHYSQQNGDTGTNMQTDRQTG